MQVNFLPGADMLIYFKKYSLAISLILLFVLLTYHGIKAVSEFEVNGSSSYLDIAKNLAEGKGYTLQNGPTAYRSPAYPLFLALFLVLLPIKYAYIGCVAGQVLLTICCFMIVVVVSRKFSGNINNIHLAPLLFVFNEPAISEFLRTRETVLFAFLILVYLFVLTSDKSIYTKSILFGIISGLCLLTRPSGLLLICMSIVAVLFFQTEKIDIKIKSIFLSLLFFVVTIAPWQIYLYKNFHRIELTGTSPSGYPLAAGNLPMFADIYVSLDPDTAGPILEKYIDDHNQTFPNDEFGRSDFLHKVVSDEIKQHPFRFANRFIQKAIYFLSPYEIYPGDGTLEMGEDGVLKINSYTTRNTIRISLVFLFKIFLIPLGILGMLSCILRDGLKAQWAIFSCFVILGATCLHAITYPEVRFRLPFESLFCLGAAYFISHHFSFRRQLPTVDN